MNGLPFFAVTLVYRRNETRLDKQKKNGKKKTLDAKKKRKNQRGKEKKLNVFP